MGTCESCQEKRSQASELVPVKTRESLHIIIIGARGLGGGSWFPNEDVSLYCQLSVNEKPELGIVNKTKRVRDSPAPRWQEEIVFNEYELGDTLQFEVMESQNSRDQSLGTVTLPYDRFRQQGFNGEVEMGSVGEDAGGFLRIKIRTKNEHYPETSMPEDFCISLDNPAQTVLGIDYDMQDGTTVHVTGLRPGLIRNYNENVKPAFQLQPGDFIVEVNSTKGSAGSILDKMRKEVHLEMIVRRPEEIILAVRIPDEDDKKGRDGKRGGRKSTCSCTPSIDSKRKNVLGLEFPRDPVGNSLVITKVNEGPIEEWNLTYPHQHIKAGDRIVEVDRERGTADMLQKKLQAANERVQLTLVRPVLPESGQSQGKPGSTRED